MNPSNSHAPQLPPMPDVGGSPALQPTAAPEAAPAGPSAPEAPRLPPAAEPSKPRRRAALRVALAAVVLTAVGGAGAWFVWGPGAGQRATEPGAAASGAAAGFALAKNVVATIDGRAVLEAELSSMLATGVDRAVAIDRYINKVLAAEAARARYADDARALSTAAEREVLANLYIQRRNQELLQAVTDEQVADYYKANVRDEDYAAYKLRYYLTRDQADAANVRSLLDKGDRAAAARLSALGNTADGFLPFQGIPYGLGQVVRRAKPGETIGPVTVRDGLLVLVLDEVRTGKKPELPAVQAEIRALLADRQLTEELLGLRKKASIQLN